MIFNTNSSGAPPVMDFRLDSVLPSLTYCLRLIIKTIKLIIILIVNV